MGITFSCFSSNQHDIPTGSVYAARVHPDSPENTTADATVEEPLVLTTEHFHWNECEQQKEIVCNHKLPECCVCLESRYPLLSMTCSPMSHEVCFKCISNLISVKELKCFGTNPPTIETTIKCPLCRSELVACFNSNYLSFESLFQRKLLCISYSVNQAITSCTSVSRPHKCPHCGSSDFSLTHLRSCTQAKACCGQCKESNAIAMNPTGWLEHSVNCSFVKPRVS